MTKEEKQLLLKAICGYLPYGLIYHRNDGANIKLEEIDVVRRLFNYTDCPEERDIKPYLRPMSSMTEEEKEELQSLCDGIEIDDDGNHFHYTTIYSDAESFQDVDFNAIDWLNEHYFDYRGLIKKGLAFEAPEGIYKTE